MKGLVEGKVALVTGAGAGIGKATALTLAEHGASVAVVDINEPLGRATVLEVEKDAGRGKFFQCDLAEPDEITRTAQTILEHFGRLDVLVNNCGISCVKNVLDTTEQEWRSLMNVNLDAMFRFSKLAIADMRQRRDGAIVNVSSLGGILGGPTGVAYCTSKFGVIGLTRSMAADHAREGIRINAVAPGMTYTEMAKAGFEKTGDPETAKGNLEKALPIGRMADPREIAAGILFLASDLASYCAGTVLAVDGGVTGCFWPHGS